VKLGFKNGKKLLSWLNGLYPLRDSMTARTADHHAAEDE